MSIRWLDSDTSIFGSFDIRNSFIKNLQKFSDIQINKACDACGIDFGRFYRAYLNNPHPDPKEVAEVCAEYQFKNLLILYGIKISYSYQVAWDLTNKEKEEIHELIREKSKGRGDRRGKKG